MVSRKLRCARRVRWLAWFTAIGLIVVAANACTSSDSATRTAVQRAMSAISPDAIGKVVGRTSGNHGGTFDDVPFRRQLVVADGPLAALDQRVSKQLRTAGFRQRFSAALMHGRPTIWESARYGRKVWVEVGLFNPGDHNFSATIPPGKLGLSFEVSGGG
jgi:hypothetical protein